MDEKHSWESGTREAVRLVLVTLVPGAGIVGERDPDVRAKLTPFSEHSFFLWGENSFYHLAKDHLRFLAESSV